MVEPIVVLNPNSTVSVTDGISEALEPLRTAGGPRIECDTLREGPPGVESDEHVASVVAPVCAYFRQRQSRAGAFVIACFSDPGLDAAREAVSVPVFGMAESGYVTALTRGERFGVISILEQAIPRHRRYLERLGLERRLAGDLPIGLGVTELGDEARALERTREVGASLRDEHGADVLLLGCAGMAPLRAPLELALGVPVIEPVQAAVTLALGAVLSAGR